MTEAAFPPPQLDLEFPTYDHYTVTVARGAIGALEVVRTHQAKTDEDALNLIDGLRDLYGSRDSVTWRDQEMPADGAMYGLATGGVVWEIMVVPPIGQLS